MFIFSIQMITLAILSKPTFAGNSVWRFVQTEDNQFFAFGGVTPACKAFASISELRSYYKAMVVKYGYEPGLTPVKPVKKAALLSDPWGPSSELPLHLQYELEALSA
jgi:hypothetical protein